MSHIKSGFGENSTNNNMQWIKFLRLSLRYFGVLKYMKMNVGLHGGIPCLFPSRAFRVLKLKQTPYSLPFALAMENTDLSHKFSPWWKKKIGTITRLRVRGKNIYGKTSLNAARFPRVHIFWDTLYMF